MNSPSLLLKSPLDHHSNSPAVHIPWNQHVFLENSHEITMKSYEITIFAWWNQWKITDIPTKNHHSCLLKSEKNHWYSHEKSPCLLIKSHGKQSKMSSIVLRGVHLRSPRRSQGLHRAVAWRTWKTLGGMVLWSTYPLVI